MHVMMTKEQFDELKKKAKSGGGKTKTNGQDKGGGKDKEEKLPKIELKEDDDTHGTIDTDDVMLSYFYNASEGRLNFSIAKKHTLAAYCAGDNIAGTYIMDVLSKIPSPEAKPGDGDAKAGGAKSGEGEGEQEKKDQLQHQSQ